VKIKKLNSRYISSLIKLRKRDSHKGDYGHVLVIAGSRGMPGAPVLCTLGALRGGAGLVSAAVPKRQYDIIAKRLRSEAMLLSLPENRNGCFSSRAFPEIKRYIRDRKVSSVVIGPGMRVNKDTLRLVKKLIGLRGITVIADADALNALDGNSKALRKAKADLIITPHPGEMSRLTGLKISEIQKRRGATAKEFAKKHRLVCVLKGAGTVISDGKIVLENSTGNPGMAKGGSGDALAGMIAALAVQVREPALLNAALAGVYIHGLAGDIAARRKSMMGMLAGDIAEAVPAALKKVTGLRFKV
jgi:NAD(P)H-hydrate epimerase